MNIFKDKRPLVGQDPHVTKYNDKFILCESLNEEKIVVSYLTDHGREGTKVIWNSFQEHQVWAPELHQIDGFWYVFYSASNGDNNTHRTMVAGAASNPFGMFMFNEQLGPDVWGIDMTQFTWKGKRYVIWSGWENNGDGMPQHLYIAEMITPVEIGERVKLASPIFDWETSIAPIVEGPQTFVDYGTLYLLYSANASWSPLYSTGLMELVGSDPLNPHHWITCPWPLLKNSGHGMMVGNAFIYARKMGFFPGWQDREIVTIPKDQLLKSKEFLAFKGEIW